MAVASTPLETIAGHEFDYNGICQRAECSLPHRKLSEILSATSANLTQRGWAHTGELNQTELNQIIKKRDAMWAAHDSR